jgi:hypothetical protein
MCTTDCVRVKKTLIDEQLIVSTFRQHLRVSAHHQEVQPYGYKNWYLLFSLDECLLSRLDWRTDSHLK